ncbi:ABC transporter ATP-binding protein [Camelimonas abortus]|uniref:ABC transporter ATP-binding protein n=1 Tax=Camelimonas abortus TaxID=1017184 RepID=A0ABV7LB99_9HYPH
MSDLTQDDGAPAATPAAPAAAARDDASPDPAAERQGLVVERLNAWYGQAHALRDVSLTVGPGEAVVLLGRNGAGKTTTLRAIMGLTRRSAVRLSFRGADIAPLPAFAIARRGLGYVPEDRRIFTDLTLDENLEAGRQPPRPGAPQWTPERLFALFPNLGRMRDRPGGAMSGGEQQMLAIARTLMGNPYMVLLDEPGEGLAPRLVEEMAMALLQLKREGLGLLVAEQNLAFARFLADRVHVLASGETRFSGTMAGLDADPARRDALLAV